jgi:hypothetical protein
MEKAGGWWRGELRQAGREANRREGKRTEGRREQQVLEQSSWRGEGVFLSFHFTNGIAFVDTILHRVLMEFAYSIKKNRLTCFPNTNYTMYAHSHQAYTPSVPF